MDIFITGIGTISCIGNNVDETYESLYNERTGINEIKIDENLYAYLGKIPDSNTKLKNLYNLKYSKSRTSILGSIAAKEAFKQHQIRKDIRTGLISGTSVGGMDLTEIEYFNYKRTEQINRNIYSHHPNGVTSNEIALELGITDYVNTISTACSSAANAIMLGARLIRSKQLDRVVVGGTDSLTKFTYNGFKSLMILSNEWCKPFDKNRTGLNLGEGAGFIVLENNESMLKSNIKPLGILSGWANASDAYHQTASSPNGIGAAMSMKKALKSANLNISQIDYINAHGTATPNNDSSESNAILTIFDKNVPPFSSTKAYTGHTLAACGGIETIISILSIKNNVLFPNLNFHHPIEETGLLPIQSVTEHKNIQHILSNSFGFSGNNSTLIISKA